MMHKTIAIFMFLMQSFVTTFATWVMFVSWDAPVAHPIGWKLLLLFLMSACWVWWTIVIQAAYEFWTNKEK